VPPSPYRYPTPAALGPHLIRVRPASHSKAKVETYSLSIGQPCQLRWHQDPAGNWVARATFPKDERFEDLEITVDMAMEINPVNSSPMLLNANVARFKRFVFVS
jgi:hypothetical protein